MRLIKLLMLGAVGMGVASMPVMAQENAAPPSTEQGSWKSTGDLLNDIHAAATPSDAVTAYARATAQMGEDANVEHAFVAKMAEFGLPEVVEAQAEDLTKRTPDDGLPWAIVAAMNARRNQMDTAATQISKAVVEAPTDPFVERTAGQVVAWFDAQHDRPLPDNVKNAIEMVRKTLSGSKTYANAYDDATQAYENSQAPAETSAPYVMNNPYVYTPDTTDYGTYYPSYTPYPYYDSYLYSPGIIFFGGFRDFRHRDFFRHDHDGDRDDHDRAHGGFHGGDFDRGHDGIGFHGGFTGPRVQTFPRGVPNGNRFVGPRPGGFVGPRPGGIARPPAMVGPRAPMGNYGHGGSVGGAGVHRGR